MAKSLLFKYTKPALLVLNDIKIDQTEQKERYLGVFRHYIAHCVNNTLCTQYTAPFDQTSCVHSTLHSPILPWSTLFQSTRNFNMIIGKEEKTNETHEDATIEIDKESLIKSIICIEPPYTTCFYYKGAFSD